MSWWWLMMIPVGGFFAIWGLSFTGSARRAALDIEREADEEQWLQKTM